MPASSLTLIDLLLKPSTRIVAAEQAVGAPCADCGPVFDALPTTAAATRRSGTRHRPFPAAPTALSATVHPSASAEDGIVVPGCASSVFDVMARFSARATGAVAALGKTPGAPQWAVAFAATTCIPLSSSSTRPLLCAPADPDAAGRRCEELAAESAFGARGFKLGEAAPSPSSPGCVRRDAIVRLLAAALLVTCPGVPIDAAAIVVAHTWRGSMLPLAEAVDGALGPSRDPVTARLRSARFWAATFAAMELALRGVAGGTMPAAMRGIAKIDLDVADVEPIQVSALGAATTSGGSVGAWAELSAGPSRILDLVCSAPRECLETGGGACEAVARLCEALLDGTVATARALRKCLSGIGKPATPFTGGTRPPRPASALAMSKRLRGPAPANDTCAPPSVRSATPVANGSKGAGVVSSLRGRLRQRVEAVRESHRAAPPNASAAEATATLHGLGTTPLRRLRLSRLNVDCAAMRRHVQPTPRRTDDRPTAITATPAAARPGPQRPGSAPAFRNAYDAATSVSLAANRHAFDGWRADPRSGSVKPLVVETGYEPLVPGSTRELADYADFVSFMNRANVSDDDRRRLARVHSGYGVAPRPVGRPAPPDPSC